MSTKLSRTLIPVFTDRRLLKESCRYLPRPQQTAVRRRKPQESADFYESGWIGEPLVWCPTPCQTPKQAPPNEQFTYGVVSEGVLQKFCRKLVDICKKSVYFARKECGNSAEVCRNFLQ